MSILDKIFGGALVGIEGIIGKFVTDPDKKLEAVMAARALTQDLTVRPVKIDRASESLGQAEQLKREERIRRTEDDLSNFVPQAA